MKEYKFRGKRIDNGEWVIGSLITDTHLKDQKIYDARIIPWPQPIMPYDWYVVDPKTVGQYTGLKDNKGREVYEGDILRHSVDKWRPNWEVRFKDGRFGIVHLPNNGYFFPCNSVYHFSDREVIGNIYEPINP